MVLRTLVSALLLLCGCAQRASQPLGFRSPDGPYAPRAILAADRAGHAPSIVLYVETLHGSLDNYSMFVERMTTDASRLTGADVTVVLWPSSATAKPLVLTPEDLRERREALTIGLTHRSAGGPQETGFGDGLQEALRLAAAADGEVFVILHSAISEFDDKQRQALKDAARQRPLTIVTFGRKPDEYVPFASKYVLSATFGSVATGAKDGAK